MINQFSPSQNHQTQHENHNHNENEINQQNDSNNNDNHVQYSHQRSLKQSVRPPIYVELLFVNDKTRFTAKSTNTETLSAGIANLMNVLY